MALTNEDAHQNGAFADDSDGLLPDEHPRRPSRCVDIGKLQIGGQNKIAVQSMTNTRTEDVGATAEQIKRLEEAGCDIVRASVYSMPCAQAISRIKEKISIPFVADVHFDHRLAIAAAENGADKLRINPGNITKPEYVSMVVDCAKQHNIPIRIGVNAGSLNKDIKARFGNGPRALVESAMQNVSMLEKRGFYNTVISVKASSVPVMVRSYELLARLCDYPLHLGVTEAGDIYDGAVKNAAGLGALLLEGIGDTIRVSLTGDPVAEVHAAHDILRALGMYKGGVEIISCPTCGRTRVALESVVRRVKEETRSIRCPLKVAVMGCAVNGPGEASDADIGIACGEGKGVLFVKGRVICALPEEKLAEELIKRIHQASLLQDNGENQHKH